MRAREVVGSFPSVKRTLLAAALLVLALAPSALASPPKASTSIVGGQTADIGDWPSIAFLLTAWDSNGDGQLDTQAQCTGTVIAPQWVVSAAHCAFRPDGRGVDGMVTVTGVGDLNDPSGEAIAADKLVVHPDWDPRTLTGDALLIHLRSPSSAPPHAVARPGGQYFTQPGVPNAAGWGATDEGATIGTELLKEAYLQIQDDDTCAHFARGFDPATQTCAGTANTAGACKGDSGGPLLVFDAATGAPVLYGLTSYGPQLGLGLKVCELKAPAVFSWVPAFSKFISDTLAPPAQQPTPSPTPPGGTTTIPARPDIAAPVLSRARLSAARLRAGRKATLSFQLSEAAAVTVTVLKNAGRSYRPLSPTLPLAVNAGTVTRRFNGRLGSRALKPGRYKLSLSAVDAAGNAARPVTVPFRIVR
jgi:secreted trypsin-like serine protease